MQDGSRDLDSRSADERSACTYCGARLDPRHYFCANCAQPWRDPRELLPDVGPMPLSTGERIALRAPQAMLLFWTYVAVIVGVGVVFSLILRVESFVVLLALSDAAVLVTTLVFCTRYWPSLAAQLRRPTLLTRPSMLALLALAPLLAFNFAYHGLFESLVGGSEPNFVVSALEDGFSHGSLVLLVCVLPAICEELAFRGLLLHWLHVAIGPKQALLVSAALFAALHGSILSAPYLFLLGLLLGWVKLETRSLYPSMLIHFVHNFLVIEWLVSHGR